MGIAGMKVEDYLKLPQRTRSREINFEDELALQLTAAKIVFVRQYKFLPTRNFKADFLLPEIKVLLEIDGGLFSKPKLKLSKAGRPYLTKSAHSSGVGIRTGMLRSNEAAILGFRMLRFIPEQVINGEALQTIFRILGIGAGKAWKPGHRR
jgi:very-short-patch-repair endonuclease